MSLMFWLGVASVIVPSGLVMVWLILKSPSNGGVDGKD